MRLPRLIAFRPPATPSTLVDLGGLGCLVGAAWWWAPIVGLVVTGLALLLIGWVMGE